MGVRFNRSIKLGNFLRINFSKKGVSATIGPKGASVNIGGNGAYLNLSPTALGIKGTGVSYRTKIGGGKKKSKKKETKQEYIEENNYIEETSAKSETTSSVKESVKTKNNDLEVVEQYRLNHEAETNIHKYTDNVITKEQFIENMDELESESIKELYQLSLEGDEDTVESLVGNFMNNIELAYDATVNYELEGNVLYVDLDLPEIEHLKDQYPTISKDKLVFKKKTSKELKEEYARLVMSLGVFLSANFFNLSPYIETIVMSAFTTVRDNNGDLVDQYLYSVKYTKDIFLETDLAELDDLYEFICKFENRINMSSAYTFKPIKPYEMESVVATNAIIDDACLGLRELGYKASDIEKILPELSTYKFENSSDYLKEGLKLLKENK